MGQVTSGRLRLFEPGEDLGWQNRAACVGVDPELFFPDRTHNTGNAKKVCRQCPVRNQCLGYALRHNEQFGVWGGLTVRERRQLLKQRRTAA